MQPAISGQQANIITDEEAKHYKWLIARLTEVYSIKVGMTRADLLKIFEPDGGLQRFLPRTYVLHSCSLIKVSVEFELPKGMSERDFLHSKDLQDLAMGRTLPIDSQIKITAVSKPYLEPMTMD